MMRSEQIHGHPVARLAAAATLVAFLLGQPWMVCAPLCLIQGHARVALAASQYQDHVIHCHSDKVVRSELPVAQSLGSMLPATVAPLLPPPRVVTLRFAAPLAVQLQQIPSADPPPPRSV